MSQTKNKILVWIMLIVMTLGTILGSISVNAASGQPLDELQEILISGSYYYIKGGKTYDYSQRDYKVDGGGSVYWYELFNSTYTNASSFVQLSKGGTLFLESKFETLKAGAKQDFLQDVFTIANAVAADGDAGNNGSIAKDSMPTTDTVSDLMVSIQNESGMGSSLLATLMSNTKPDYAKANKIYEPFSGVIGTILGIVSILIMALLGVTMALDLAFITIPAFQMAMQGDENAKGGGEKGRGIGRIISVEAKQAVAASEGGQGGQASNGDYKAAVGIYFRYRWKGLVILGICLLYLVQGEIYSFVAWFIDLFSGFLGF